MVKPGYKQTEVGEIPEDWDIKTIGGLGDVVRGGSPRPAGDPRYFNGNYIPWLTVASLTQIPQNKIFVDETASCLTEEGSKRSRILERNTLIISNSGATLGVAKILNLRCCANDGIAALLNQKFGNKEFLVQYINTKTKYLHDIVASGNGQPNLNTDLISLIKVPYPTEKEQEAIAKALSDVDDLIVSLEKLIAKKQDIKTATMQQLLTGKKRLPGFGEGKGYKQTELGPIPEDWDVVCLLDASNCIHGKAHEQFISKNGKYSVVNSKFVSTEGAVEKYSDKNFCPALLGDVLMVLSDLPNGKALAKCYFSDKNDTYAVNQRVCIFRSKNVNEKFLYYQLNRNKFFLALDDGVTQTHILNGDIKRCQIIIPNNPEEQKNISEILFDLDQELLFITRQLKKIRNVKQGMMQELLTGRTRLI